MSAELSLRRALVAAVRPLVPSQRFFDHVPAKVDYPFAMIGEVQHIDDGTSCAEDAAEIFVDIHVYSRDVGRTECHQISALIRSALHAKTLPLTGGWQMNTMHVRDTRTLTEPDGLTSHAIINVRVLVDPV